MLVQNEFGPAVRTIVEGETKFSKIGELSSEMGSKGDVKARDLQHLFLAMTKEVCASDPQMRDFSTPSHGPRSQPESDHLINCLVPASTWHKGALPVVARGILSH